MCYCPLVTAQTAEKLPSISLPSMAAINGKYHSVLCLINMNTFLIHILTLACREVSHPNMIELNAFTAKGYPECANIAQLSAVSLKSSKSLIWITGRDRSKSLMS